MLIFVAITWLLMLLYAVLMLAYARGWRLQDEYVLPKRYLPLTKISVIIPARNEEANIEKCIRAVLANNYPKELLEIIVIDDHSADNTWHIISSLPLEQVKGYRLSDLLEQGTVLNAYKKKAIETAIAKSSADLVVTTDADCTMGANWLRNIAAIYEQEQPVMIAGPVAFNQDNKLVSVFQSLDFMSMQGITVAANRLRLGNMSNGANLAFSREAFERVGGYKGIDHLASGDDFLLMMKMQKAFPGRMSYLKSQQAIVYTNAQPDWKSFLNQRIRWASKSGKYDDKKLTAVLGLVYLFNVMFLMLLVLGLFDTLFLKLLLGTLLLKIAVELYFLLPVAAFYKKEKELLWFPFLQPLHIGYIILAGLLGFIGVYQWKGRSVK